MPYDVKDKCEINSAVECLPSKQNVRSSNLLFRSREIGAVVAQLLYTQTVTSSNLVSPISNLMIAKITGISAAW